jgi:hypothetical protein
MSFLVGNGAVEVVALNKIYRTMHFIVHVQGKPEVSRTVLDNAYATDRVRSAQEYLINEGFVQRDISQWLSRISIIYHPV